MAKINIIKKTINTIKKSFTVSKPTTDISAPAINASIAGMTVNNMKIDNLDYPQTSPDSSNKLALTPVMRSAANNNKINSIPNNAEDLLNLLMQDYTRGINIGEANRVTAWNTYLNYYLYLPNPDLILKASGHSVEIYKDIITDPFVYGCIQARKAGSKGKQWKIEQGDSSDGLVEFIENWLKLIDIPTLLVQILDAPLFGMQIFEKIWDIVNGYYLPTEIMAKPIEWFNFDSITNILKFRTKANVFGEPISLNKFLLVQHNGTYENPYGESILSKCYWDWTFKKAAFRTLVKFCEGFGMPYTDISVMHYEDENELARIRNNIKNMVEDGVVAHSSEAEIKFLFADPSSNNIHEALIQVCQDNISSAILGHQKGIQSTAGHLGGKDETKGDIMDAILKSDQALLEQAMNSIIRNIIDINFGEDEEAPSFSLYEELEIDMTLAQRDTLLWKFIEPSEDYILKAYGFQNRDFKIRTTPLGTGGGGSSDNSDNNDNSQSGESPLSTPNTNDDNQGQSGEEPSQNSNNFTQSAKTMKGQKIIDNSIESLFKKCRAEIGTLNNDVLKFVKGESNYSDALSALAKQFPKLKTEELNDKLVIYEFMADTIGRLEVQSEIKK